MQLVRTYLHLILIIGLTLWLSACGGTNSSEDSEEESSKIVWDQSNWDEKNWQ